MDQVYIEWFSFDRILSSWTRVVLTLLDAEVRHDEDDGVSGEDVVAAVDVLAVDGEAAAGEDGDHPVDHEDGGDVARLLGTLVARVRPEHDTFSA